MNESSQEMEFNLDSSHSAEDEKKLKNENQLPESLRPYFELVDREHYAVSSLCEEDGCQRLCTGILKNQLS